MLVMRHHVGQRFQVNIIAMGLKFNRLVLIVLTLFGLCGLSAFVQAAPPLPLIVPEATFVTLPRITGTTLNQRMMDTHSLIRIQLGKSSDPLSPNTPLTVIRQGLRLRSPDGKILGVLAIPVAQGHTLSEAARIREIAEPVSTNTDWMRLDVLYQETMRGDSVMTRAEVKAVHRTADHCAAAAISPPPASEVIALASHMDLMATRGELVVISGGCQAGLGEGRPVSLWRPAATTFGRKLDQAVEDPKNDSNSVFEDNPAISREKTPGHRVADGRVVTAYDNAAIVQIHALSQAVQPGDLIRINAPSKR